MYLEKPVMQTIRVAAAAVFLLLGAGTVHAAAPPPPPPPPAVGPGYNAGPGSPGMPKPPGGGKSLHGPSLQLGPAGRWWDNKSYARTIGLKQEQQKRMDAVFNANKGQLFHTYRTLKTEEDKLDTLQRAESPDEDSILKQIDTVSALRGQLEKQSAALALGLRKELTTEQVQQLESPK
jgi:hypothetical protein